MKISKVGGVIAVANREIAKPLLHVGTIPIIRRIVITYQQVGIFPVVVVVSGDFEELKRELASFGVIFLEHGEKENPELMDSVFLGLHYLQGKCDRVAFTPVNVPMFTPTTLLNLINTEGNVVAPSCNGRGGHPILIADHVIPQILSYRGSGGLRQFWNERTSIIRTVSVDDQGVWVDLDTQEDYAKCKTIYEMKR